MLINCPKCDSVYEIPDDLISKTGKKFRCQKCLTIWHCMPEDAIDFEELGEEKLRIDAIPVPVPPHRNYPANKDNYTIPVDKKPGVQTRSSQQLINDEGDKNFSYTPKDNNKEITLTSNQGTSFTISTTPFSSEETDNKKTPHLFNKATSSDVYIKSEDKLTTATKNKKKNKGSFITLLLILISLTAFLRREAVMIYPKAENWYNKVGLSGLNNSEYLKFEQLNVSNSLIENKPSLKISVNIKNTSIYSTYVPEITISGIKETFKTQTNLIKGSQSTHLDINIPLPQNTDTFILGFKH